MSELSDVQTVQNNIIQLQNALLSSHPSMPSLLAQIHTSLKKDPELVTILTDEERGIIINGLKKQTQIEIATKAAGKKSTSVSKFTEDDLF